MAAPRTTMPFPRRCRTSPYSPARILLIFLGTLSTGLILPTFAQGSKPWDPRSSICSLNLHRATVVGESLYVDGGEMLDASQFKNRTNIPVANSTVTRWQNEFLWKLDLSKEFDTRAPPWEALSKPNSPYSHYNGAQGTLWNFGDGRFHTIGGFFSMKYGPDGKTYGLPIINSTRDYQYQLPAARFFTCDASGPQPIWSYVHLDDIPMDNRDMKRISGGSWTQSVRGKTGYTLGGMFITEHVSIASSNNLPPPVQQGNWLDTMTMFDLVKEGVTQDPNAWKKHTQSLPAEIGYTSDGFLISLDRVGDDGVLLFFGGDRLIMGQETKRSMDNIWIYDVASKNWYNQTATGEVPAGRDRSCAVMVPAPDLSSYQIYVFAGALEGGTMALDMYVLTVPSFIWKKIELNGYPDNFPMSAHACTLFKSQMLIVPGEQNASATADGDWTHHCNTGTSIQLFDTFTWNFSTKFNLSTANEDPRVPPGIIPIIGGDENGHATLRQPQSGFQSPELTKIFSVLNSDVSPTPTNNPDNKTTNHKKSSSVPMIIGAAIGSVVGSCLLMTGLIVSCRRRQRNKDGVPAELGGIALPPGEMMGDVHHKPPMGDVQHNPPHELHGSCPPVVEAGSGIRETQEYYGDAEVKLKQKQEPMPAEASQV